MHADAERERDARARALLDAIPDLVFRIGRDGVYRAFKAEDPSELASAPDEIVGYSLYDRLPHHVAERIMTHAERAFRDRTVEEIEYDLEIGGEVRHFEGRVVAIGDDEFFLMVRDFTQRKRAEHQLASLAEQLRRERDFTRTVVSSAKSYLVLTDPEGRIVGFNRTFERATGWPDDESTRGKPFWDVFLPDDEVERALNNVALLLGGGNPDEREFRIRTNDGRELVVDWSATPIRDEEGSLKLLFSGLDITDRVRHAEELRRSRARIVDAGDAERKRLERNLHDGAQQQLTAVSQRIRLAERALQSDQPKARALLEEAAQVLAEAHQELRELARGLHPSILTDRGLLPALRVLARRASIPVALSGPEDERFPERAETTAYYVASEALANVAKYAGASQVAVGVAASDGRLVIEVRDDGVGGADAAGGSGLRGLADRVEAVDGRLVVESPPGAGTVVRAEIPL
jgi:PAS domain S-box-containing protein